MRKSTKKFIAAICAGAMIISSAAISDSTISMADEQSASTEQNPSTYAASSADLLNSAFLIGDAGAGQFKVVCGNGLIDRVVNIQKDENAAEYGIYVAFKDASFGEMTVNGVELDAFINGAGITMYLSNFIYKYSDVVIKSGDGTQKAVLYVYNSQGIDNSSSAIVPESTTVDTSTELELTRLADTTTYQSFGGYNIKITPGMEAYAGIDPSNKDHLQVRNASGPSTNSFSVNKTFTGLTAGVKYVLSVDITPSVVNGSYKTLKDPSYIPLQAGTTTVSMVSTAYSLNGVTQADFALYVNMLGADVILDISNPQYSVYVEGETTTPEPTISGGENTTSDNTDETTIADGGDETTTLDIYCTMPTPPETSTTVTPTSKPYTTTVVPATTLGETTATDTECVPPAKAKIKKVTPKKKAAKLLKLKLKKVKGAVGYQVQISKTKKFTKKNILVKKHIKKLNVSFNSKKIKNKGKLFVRARAYVLDNNGKKVYGIWSKVKQAKIK